MGTAAEIPLRLITTSELDREDIDSAVASLADLVRAGRVSKLVFVAEIDGETYLAECPGCSGMQALALHEVGKATILEDVLG